MVDRTLAGSLGLKGGWALGENGWDVDMEANLLWLSVLVQGRYIDQVSALPGAPTEGDVYVMAAADPTNPNAIAAYDNGAWSYRAPKGGWRLYNTTLSIFAQFDGTSWVHDTVETAEDVRDIIGAALTSGTNVTVVPDDAADTITVNATDDMEAIQDMLSSFLVPGSNVSLTYDDTANHLTVQATGLLRLIPFFFTTSPAADEILAIYTAVDAFTFAANFAGSSVKMLTGGTAPVADFVIDVRVNNVSVGSITISAAGAVTFATTSGASVAIAIGDIVSFHAQHTADTLTNWTFNMKGVIG